MMRIKTVLKKLADSIFPYIPWCVVCGVEKNVSELLCPACAAELETLSADDPEDSRLTACAVYRYEGAAARLVRRYKYGGDKWLSAFMANRMAAVCSGIEAACICHVPLHKNKRRIRGFDQAEELARRVAEYTGIPFVSAVRRVRNTKTQTRLSAAQRRENMQGAFESVAGVSGHVLLIDDVMTTGATADECAAVLKAAGAGRVTVLTFARAILKES